MLPRRAVDPAKVTEEAVSAGAVEAMADLQHGDLTAHVFLPLVTQKAVSRTGRGRGGIPVSVKDWEHLLSSVVPPLYRDVASNVPPSPPRR